MSDVNKSNVFHKYNEPAMTSRRHFVFRDEQNDFSLRIIIPETIHPQYGLFTWPSAPILAQYIFHNRNCFKSKCVLEIGAGTSLPGIVAAKVGASKIYLSDAEEFNNCLENCFHSCRINDVKNFDVIAITWGKVSKLMTEINRVDYVIASDCFYDKKDFEDIMFTVAFLLNRHDGASFIFSYQMRDENLSIEELLLHWDLKAKEIPLSSFSGDTINEINQMPSSHLIQLFCVKKK